MGLATRQIDESGVQGVLHEPAERAGAALILTHGAGSNGSAPLLVSVGEAFAAAGVAVLRYDLPFRQQRPHGPPRPGDAARDREGIGRAVTLMRERGFARVFAAGHSYGGRQTTLLAAENPELAEALLLLSYPLHPPRRPEQLRTGHFPGLRTPGFFVHGSRDPFGGLDEMRRALKLIPAPTFLLPVEGAGHDLRRGKAAAAELPAAIARDFLGWAMAGA